MTSDEIKALAHGCGFELAGVAPAGPLADSRYYADWVAHGMAGEMRYLTDHRAVLREDARNLLPSARSVICVGKLYQGPEPYSSRFTAGERGWISRYAWGDDYHEVLRAGLERLAAAMGEVTGAFEHRICVDTAPLLERAYAREAGLGWIGKNTCLINQPMGSWFFLGEMLVDLELAPDSPPADRCGTCRRCIDACPTQALVPDGKGRYQLDARLCISYFTIELRGTVPEAARAGIGAHVFGCDICQEVCPWNRRAPNTGDAAFASRLLAPPLERLASITEREFRDMFRDSAVKRSKYQGFLRNVAIAMGNSGSSRMRGALEKLAQSRDAVVAEHARWGLLRLG